MRGGLTLRVGARADLEIVLGLWWELAGGGRHRTSAMGVLGPRGGVAGPPRRSEDAPTDEHCHVSREGGYVGLGGDGMIGSGLLSPGGLDWPGRHLLSPRGVLGPPGGVLGPPGGVLGPPGGRRRTSAEVLRRPAQRVLHCFVRKAARIGW